MTIRTPETLINRSESDELNLQRRKMLEVAHSLDSLGKRFERFVSIQLQQIEVAIDDFQRERAAWQRQRDREMERLRKGQTVEEPGHRSQTFETIASTTSLVDSIGFVLSDEDRGIGEIPGSASAPLKMLLLPGSASALQIGLVLFEISKYNRELGGGGVRFEVGVPRVPRKSAFQGEVPDDEPGAILCLEAFSCTPLLTYDGRPTRHLQRWDFFKSEILMSTLIDQKLWKQYQKGHDVSRTHMIREVALEATRRADVANSKVDTVDDRILRRFNPPAQEKKPVNQQLKRVEQVIGFLQNDCKMRIHLSLV